MKQIKLTVIALTIALLGMTATSAKAQHEDQYDVFMYAILGPVKSSALYDAWASNTVYQLYLHGSLTGVGDRMMAEYVTQVTPDWTNFTLWYATRAIVKNTADRVAFSQLIMSEDSSDPGHAFAQTNWIATTPNLIYSDHGMGVIWTSGSHDPRSDTLLTSGQSGTNGVHEIDFIGEQSGFYQASVSAVSNLLSGYTNFFLNGMCTITNGTGAVVAHGQKTLQTKGAPVPCVLVPVVSGTNVVIGFNMEANRTGIVRSSLNPYGSFDSWALEATVNSGDQIVRPKTDQKHFYWLCTE